MGVVEELKNILESNITNSDNKSSLEDALELYHELVQQKILVPRGNQLIKDSILYQNSNLW